MLVSFMSVEMLLSLKLVFDAIDFFTENAVLVGLNLPESIFFGDPVSLEHPGYDFLRPHS